MTGSPPPRLPPRTAAYQRFMALPLGFALFLLLATGLLFLLALRGGTPEGDRVQLSWAGCVEAGPVVLARAEAVGLGAPVLRSEGDRIVLEATLPGLPDDDEAIPTLLARPGTLALRDGSGGTALTEAAVLLAQVRLDEAGLPYTWVEVEESAYASLDERIKADPEGSLQVLVDGNFLVERPNSREVSDGGVRLVEGVEMDSKRRMRRAVDRSIALTHGPLPCSLTDPLLRPLDGSGSAR